MTIKLFLDVIENAGQAFINGCQPQGIIFKKSLVLHQIVIRSI